MTDSIGDEWAFAHGDPTHEAADALMEELEKPRA